MSYTSFCVYALLLIIWFSQFFIVYLHHNCTVSYLASICPLRNVNN